LKFDKDFGKEHDFWKGAGRLRLRQCFNDDNKKTNVCFYFALGIDRDYEKDIEQ